MGLDAARQNELSEMFKRAVENVLAGSKPWEAENCRRFLDTLQFSPETKRDLGKFLDDAIEDHKAALFREAMQKILTGATEKETYYEMADKIARMGAPVNKTSKQQATGLSQFDVLRAQEALKHKIEKSMQQQYANAAMGMQNQSGYFNKP